MHGQKAPCNFGHQKPNGVLNHPRYISAVEDATDLEVYVRARVCVSQVIGDS